LRPEEQHGDREQAEPANSGAAEPAAERVAGLDYFPGSLSVG